MNELLAMKDELFYDIRHLKLFKETTGNDNGGVWRIKWNDGDRPMIYNDKDESIKFYVDDIQLAVYIVSLHNCSKILIKEVESKYGT
jgi:hypothetical protein